MANMLKRTIAACAMSLLLTCGLGRSAVEEPWVTTDRTVDASSYETIVAAVCKDLKTDEEKAIALYNYFRQTVYHFFNLPESREPLKTINVIGNTLCGSQATCMKGILGAAGIKARVVSHPGHTFYEAFYDGEWHGFDTFTNFYVYKTKEDGTKTVASFGDLKGKPDFIKKAIAEGNAAPNICPCGDRPTAFADPIKVNNYMPRTSKWRVTDYSLRPGEELVRSWWPLGKPVPGSWKTKQGPGPLHTCGTKDRRAEPFLFKFWEPYGVPKMGPSTTVSYRHYFNGYMNYAPDLTSKAFLDGGAQVTGVAESPEGLAGEGSYVFTVKCPFYITGGVLLFETTCPTAEDTVTLSVLGAKKKWAVVSATQDAESKVFRAKLDSLVAKARAGIHSYQVKFELKGKAVLNHFYLRTWFTHNAMAAPHLMPGKNKIALAVKNADALSKHPITIVYNYKEAPAWSELKTIEKKAEAMPFTFEAELPETQKLPQMQDLTIRCGQIAWMPKKKDQADKIICDFSKKEDAEKWSGDTGMTVSHDGTGLLIEVPKKSAYPQASMKGLTEDWSAYKTIVVEFENIGPKAQNVIFRVRSNGDTKKRDDFSHRAGKGRSTLRVPVSSLAKCNAKEIDKIYVMTAGVPDEGCKIRVHRIYLIPDRSL